MLTLLNPGAKALQLPSRVPAHIPHQARQGLHPHHPRLEALRPLEARAVGPAQAVSRWRVRNRKETTSQGRGGNESSLEVRRGGPEERRRSEEGAESIRIIMDGERRGGETMDLVKEKRDIDMKGMREGEGGTSGERGRGTTIVMREGEGEEGGNGKRGRRGM